MRVLPRLSIRLCASWGGRPAVIPYLMRPPNCAFAAASTSSLAAWYLESSSFLQPWGVVREDGKVCIKMVGRH